MHADLALKKLLTMDFDTVLDIGSGKGEHAEVFRKYEKIVTTVDYNNPEADYHGDFVNFYYTDDTTQGLGFECAWCSHVLEHQLNVHQFLDQCYGLLQLDGLLAITVPPRKDNIVGGHVTLWNAGLLLYNLILAGFDCSEAMVKT